MPNNWQRKQVQIYGIGKLIVGSASDMKTVTKKSADLSAPAEMMA
jgi:hypothetical protein